MSSYNSKGQNWNICYFVAFLMVNAKDCRIMFILCEIDQLPPSVEVVFNVLCSFIFSNDLVKFSWQFPQLSFFPIKPASAWKSCCVWLARVVIRFAARLWVWASFSRVDLRGVCICLIQELTVLNLVTKISWSIAVFIPNSDPSRLLRSFLCLWFGAQECNPNSHLLGFAVWMGSIAV